MKKNILIMSLLLAINFSQAIDLSKTESDHYYIMSGNAQVDISLIVSCEEMHTCLVEQSIELFEAIKAKLEVYYLNIFKVRIYGRSFLQNAIEMHYESPGFNFHHTSQKRSDAFIDHLLSQIDKEDLNEFIDTYKNFLVYPKKPLLSTAVAAAATCSLSCFKKIIAHKYFDPTTFLQSQIDPLTNTPSLSLQECIEILEQILKSHYADYKVRKQFKALLIALEEFASSQSIK